MSLNLDKLTNMIFQLVVFQLLKILRAQNHVLNELGNFLIKLNHIRLLVNKITNIFPGRKGSIVAGFLLTSSEATYHAAQHLASRHCLRLRLFDSQDIIIAIKVNARKGIKHFFFYHFFSERYHNKLRSFAS
jgi:hypothetical protein